MEQKGHTNFSGTYFDKDVVLRLERWLRVIAWLVLITYGVEASYNVYQNVYNSVAGSYPIDFFYTFLSFSRIFQGAGLFAVIYAIAKGLLILLDIEDNTRRAARK